MLPTIRPARNAPRYPLPPAESSEKKLIVTTVSTASAEDSRQTPERWLEIAAFVVSAALAPAGASAAILVLCAFLLASVAVLVARFRRSRDAERQQMLWLVVGVAPLPFCVVGSFVAAYTHHETLAGVAVSLGIAALAVGAGFSVAKYRLYDVERAVSDAGAYVMASASVVAIYAAVTVVLTRSIPVATGSTVTTIAATLAAAGH